MPAKKVLGKKVAKSGVAKEGKVLGVDEALDMLKKSGIPVAPYAVAKDIGKAAAAAKKIGYPVVIKLISSQASHKTDVGGVFIDLKDEKELCEAFGKLQQNAKRASVKVDSVLVQKMASGGRDVIVGGKKDAQFGQTILFGAGGIFVEAFGDVSMRVVPIVKADAEEMMNETKIFKTLVNFRGKDYDTAALTDTLMKVSKLLAAHPEISELDINPVVVLPKGKGVLAVDARIVLS
jgi:acyl-CoA synthetase (NDP forming)